MSQTIERRRSEKTVPIRNDTHRKAAALIGEINDRQRQKDPLAKNITLTDFVTEATERRISDLSKTLKRSAA